MRESLVSVVIPVFNASKYLAEAIDSVLAQSYRPIEIIAVDDGSTDDSLAVLRGYGDKVIVIEQPNGGQGVARNTAVDNSSGEYIAFLDADDIWDPVKLEKQVALLERHPEAVAVYCDHCVIDSNGDVVATTAALGGPRVSGRILNNLLEYSVIVTPSLVMTRRSAFDAAQGFDVESPRWAEDHGLWLRISYLGPIIYDITNLVGYRRHDSNTYNGPSANFAIGNICALKRLLAFLSSDENPALIENIERKIYIKTIELAFRYVGNGDWRSGIKTYLRAIRVRPFCNNAWLGLINIPRLAMKRWV
ncbi:MAG: hypothetical protein B7Y41_04725 [Hydrogenophilales bacterium 28-61-23]|nr:MAG: hypothetical protein B7Y41_04725 [Hydrogenophilales bacterium 28-61-23]